MFQMYSVYISPRQVSLVEHVRRATPGTHWKTYSIGMVVKLLTIPVWCPECFMTWITYIFYDSVNVTVPLTSIMDVGIYYLLLIKIATPPYCFDSSYPYLSIIVPFLPVWYFQTYIYLRHLAPRYGYLRKIVLLGDDYLGGTNRLLQWLWNYLLLINFFWDKNYW